jgi:4-hydroxybenzoate polyprenyltransferase
MAFNRLIDAKWDAKNPRTAKRHLPTGKLSPNGVKWFIAVNGMLFIASAATLNMLAFVCALPVWLFLLSYSYWKRFSWACHIFLGIAIGLSPLGAWIAVRGEFALFPGMLGALLALWITGFDIIYATQDEEKDREMGLHSIPVQFGRDGAVRIALRFHIAMITLWIGMGFLFSLSWPWWIGALLTTIILFYIHKFRRSSDLDSLNQDFFLANIAISIICFIALAAIVFFNGGLPDVSWLS